MATAPLLAGALQGRERDKPSVIAFTREGIANLQQIKRRPTLGRSRSAQARILRIDPPAVLTGC